MLASVLAGFIYSFLTITLRANQNVTGLTLTIFGSGVANFFGGAMNKLAGGVGQISVSATSGAYRATLPFLSNVGVFSSLGFMTYLAIVLAFIMSWFLLQDPQGPQPPRRGRKSRYGGRGGHQRDTVQVPGHLHVGRAITGLGGLYYVMDYIKGTWANDGGIEKLGWLAVALVIFARWKPRHAIWGSYLFGVLFWLYFYIGGLTRSSQEIFKMLPVCRDYLGADRGIHAPQT